MRRGWRLHAARALAIFGLLVTACGGSSSTASVSPNPSRVASPSPVASPTPTPSPTPTHPGFTYPINPYQARTTATGTIHVTNDAGKLTIEIKITGLQGGSSHVSHVHAGTCGAPGGIIFALQQVTADGQGNADAVTMVQQSFPPSGTTWYAVVHQGADMQGTNANYLMCGNLK